MRFRRKLKRTTRQYIIVALICIVLIGTVAISTSIIMIGQIRGEYEDVLNEAVKEMNDNKRTVYIALDDINVGEFLDMELVEERTVYSTQPAESYIVEDELGKAAMIDIPKGTHIIKGMLAEHSVSSVIREVEYEVIHIGANIEANDFVDVRILYPNGENYIVLSKKSLKGFQPGTPLCYLWVDEEELLRMSAAIVDAGLYQGSRLFMTKYIEPNIQDPSTVTYTPNISVLSLIENDPNIINRYSQMLNKEVRMALENRLAERFDLDVSDISWYIDEDNIRFMPEMAPQKSKVDGSNVEGFGYEEPVGDDKEDGYGEYFGVEREDGVDEYVASENGEDSDERDNREDRENVNNTMDVNSVNDEPSSYFPELGKTNGGENYYLATEG